MPLWLDVIPSNNRHNVEMYCKVDYTIIARKKTEKISSFL